MKRILVWIAVLCTLCTMAIPALAAENDSVAVVYGADFDYIINIPACIASETNTNKHYVEVTVESALLPSNTAMTVSITGKSYKDGKWHMSNAESTVAYSVMCEKDGKYAEVTQDTEVLYCAAGDKCPITASLCFVFGNDTAGTYNDILTFVIKYTEIQK